MLNLSTSSSKILSGTKKILAFIFGLLTVYLLVIFIMTAIRPGSLTLYQLVTHNYRATGEAGYTLERFREIELYQDIDILFIGSSHYHSVEYIDFNSKLKLDIFSHFMDKDHLNSTGVDLFNNSLLNILISNKTYAGCIFDDNSRILSSKQQE